MAASTWGARAIIEPIWPGGRFDPSWTGGLICLGDFFKQQYLIIRKMTSATRAPTATEADMIMLLIVLEILPVEVLSGLESI